MCRPEPRRRLEGRPLCLDDASRIAFAKILPDERKESAVAFLQAALADYASLCVSVPRVMTDILLPLQGLCQAPHRNTNCHIRRIHVAYLAQWLIASHESEIVTMITARLLSAAAARLKPWRAKHPPSEHVAPLSLACALLFCACILVGDSKGDLSDLPASRLRSWLKSDIDPALAAVRASMIEIPPETEAAVVAQRVNRAQMVLLENRHLAVELRALKADFAELKHGHEAELAELQKSVRRTRSEVLWLLSQKKNFESDVKFLIAERHRVETLTSLDSRHSGRFGDHDLNAEDQERAGQLAEIPIPKPIGTETYTLENSRPPLVETDQSAMQAIKSIALTIAGGLEDTRTEAIMSGKERAFIVDVEKRLVRTSSSDDPILINSDLNLILHTAKSELLSPRSGRIVFLPDGTSTGGRIDLELYGGRATIGIDWSTGAVTVER